MEVNAAVLMQLSPGQDAYDYPGGTDGNMHDSDNRAATAAVFGHG